MKNPAARLPAVSGVPMWVSRVFHVDYDYPTGLRWPNRDELKLLAGDASACVLLPLKLEKGCFGGPSLLQSCSNSSEKTTLSCPQLECDYPNLCSSRPPSITIPALVTAGPGKGEAVSAGRTLTLLLSVA